MQIVTFNDIAHIHVGHNTILPIDIRKDKGILSTLIDKGKVVGIEILFM